MNEYEFEPIRGLPEDLPPGEEILWQGEPNWRSLGYHAFHVRSLGIYFTALIGLHLGARLMQGHPMAEIVTGMSWQLGLAALTLGILTGIAGMYARSTVYTLTNRRLVLRYGVAVPMMINLPLDKVASADLRTFREGTGDIALTPRSEIRLSYWALWPNIRPWRFSPVQPNLRCVEDPERVAALLAEAVAATGAGVERSAQVAREDHYHGAAVAS